MTSPSNPRRRRAHPARRSRRAAGALSVGATLALAGGMAIGTHHAAAKSSTTVTTTSPSSSSSDAESSTGTDNGSSWFNVPAQSGNVSSNPVTSTHAS